MKKLIRKNVINNSIEAYGIQECACHGCNCLCTAPGITNTYSNGISQISAEAYFADLVDHLPG